MAKKALPDGEVRDRAYLNAVSSYDCLRNSMGWANYYEEHLRQVLRSEMQDYQLGALRRAKGDPLKFRYYELAGIRGQNV